MMGLHRVSPACSRGVVVLSVLAGLAGGVCGVGLIALIHAELSRRGGLGADPGPGVPRALRGHGAVAGRRAGGDGPAGAGDGLPSSACRSAAGCSVPLATFEGLDPAGVLAVLTEDIVIVANALVGIPLLCINLPIVVACLAYVGWLSPAVLACGLVFAALAIAVYAAAGAAGHAPAPASPARGRIAWWLTSAR